MPADFLYGQVQLLHKRCQVLQQHLASLLHLPDDILPHVTELNNSFSELESDIVGLLADPDFSSPRLLPNFINEYKQLCWRIEALEGYRLSLFDRYNEKDYYLYRFVDLFCKQVSYPYTPPLLNAHGDEYFSAWPLWNLINAPFATEHFLLEVPDLIHEVGHIFYMRNSFSIERRFLPVLRKHIDDLKAQMAHVASQSSYVIRLDTLYTVWAKHILNEFFCDMFACYLVGPAYGWSHLRLVLAAGSGLYTPSLDEMTADTTHPADDARMRGILLMLDEMGCGAEARAIDATWQEFDRIVQDKRDGEYDYCYPDSLLKELAATVKLVCAAKGLVAYYDQPMESSNLPSLMRMAWEQFNSDPATYSQWETDTTNALRGQLNMPAKKVA